jgi:predicted MPP superfamily phosphohydrolase
LSDPESDIPCIRRFPAEPGPAIQYRSLAGFEWNRVELTIPGLSPALEGVRLIHLSDLHLRRALPAELEQVIERINAEPRPAMVVFTGDLVDDKRDPRPALPAVERLIKSLKPTAGIYAVTGNHDGDLLTPRLNSWGVRVLLHERIEVSVNTSRIELIGLPGADRVDLDERFLRTLPPKRIGVPRVVLCHYPDLIRQTRGHNVDLYLAGHTHGGQICLPNGLAMMTHDTLPRRMCKGAHDVEGTCLIVNRGFGFTTIPLRVFCPAEVVEVELKRET